VPPRWTDFNAAAREADRSGRDRSLITYVRGAYSEQKDNDSGVIATRYHRTGTTWSALALSYRNPLGQMVVLVQLFWVRGNANSNNDVRRYFLIFERDFNLEELKTFDLDVRKLKQMFPDAFIRDEFSTYCERFRRLLGIDSDMALRLIHKTQSAKNLGDLNSFLRDFMLDKPATFEVADRLVNEFSELNAAHQSVVIAREQVQILTPAREAHQQLLRLQYKKTTLDEEHLGMDSYREAQRIKLLTQNIATLQVQQTALLAEMQRHAGIVTNHKAHLRDLEQRHRDSGGDRIEQLEAEKNQLEIQRTERLRKRDQAHDICKKLSWTFSDTQQGFAELTGQAREEMENWQQKDEETRNAQVELIAQKKTA